MGLLLALMMLGMIGPMLLGDVSDSATDGSDRIEGGETDDTLAGGGGADLLVAGGGDDTISGGDGTDWIFAGDGDDVISGGDGDDVILPGSGADRVDAGAGDDFIEAADLVDVAALNASLDTARSFADIVFAYAFDAVADAGDSIDAGAGNDTIVAGPDDTVTGGDGADEIATGDWGQDGPPVVVIDFDPDEDILTYTYREGTAAPTMTTATDPDSGDVTVLADGWPAAVLRNLPLGYDPNRVVVKLWRNAA